MATPVHADRNTVKSLTRSNLSELNSVRKQEKQQRVKLAPDARQMHMNIHINAPTTIATLQSPDNVFVSPDQPSRHHAHSVITISKNTSLPESGSGDGKTSVPYPFMAGFVDRLMGNRFNKRVVFEREINED